MLGLPKPGVHDWLNLGNVGQPRMWLSEVPDQANDIVIFIHKSLWPVCHELKCLFTWSSSITAPTSGIPKSIE